MTMTPDLFIEKMDAAMKAATDGPWYVYSEPDVGLGPSLFAGLPPHQKPLEPLSVEDMRAIVAMRIAVPHLRAHIDAQAATIARAIAIIEHCDVTEGVCCCGDDMDTHAEPMSCGHSPVDHGSYTASQWLDEARATLTGAASE